jgi:hypothetical protein
MANIRKSFNFRSGVQVDNDNFIVNANGLVGIGTSAPTEFFDLRGNAKIVGLLTANNLAVSGVSTFYSDVKVGSGITLDPSTGAVNATTFYGSAAGLTGFYAVATDGWYIDTANSGIFTTFNVGIGTTLPQYSLQIGEDPLTGNGFSVDELTGNVNTTGIITANSFVGVGTDLTDLNASNISSGTISSERLPVLPNPKLPSDINVTGIITAQTYFSGTLVGIASTARDLISNARINIEAATIGVSTVSTRLRTNGAVGINTDEPYAAVHIVGSSSTSLHLTADTTTITLGRSLSPTGNTAGLRFGNASGLYPSSTTKSLDIINYDTGNLNHYLHYGAAGVGTGNFNWLYGPNSSSPLMTLTYDGNLGIGITNPTNTLDIIGTLKVTNNSTFDGNVTLTNGDLNISNGIITGNLTGNVTGILFGNVYTLTGISTFNDITSTTINSSQVLIGTDSSNYLFQSSTGNETFFVSSDGTVGIGTTQSFYSGLIFNVSGTSGFRGDIYVGEDQSEGLVLTSPNGTRYRLIVDNSGNLSTAPV